MQQNRVITAIIATSISLCCAYGCARSDLLYDTGTTGCFNADGGSDGGTSSTSATSVGEGGATVAGTGETTSAGGAGGVGGSGGEAGEGGGGGIACGCELPPGMNEECAVAAYDGTGCQVKPTLNGLPCRSGVGTCNNGTCFKVGWPEECTQAPSSGPWPICMSDSDCDDGNDCTSDYCPEPGCGACVRVPVADLRPCGASGAMVCRGGSCCDPPPGFSGP